LSDRPLPLFFTDSRKADRLIRQLTWRSALSSLKVTGHVERCLNQLWSEYMTLVVTLQHRYSATLRAALITWVYSLTELPSISRDVTKFKFVHFSHIRNSSNSLNSFLLNANSWKSHFCHIEWLALYVKTDL